MAERIEDIIRALAQKIDEEKRLADKRARQLYLADKCARAYLNTTQTDIPNLTYTKILLDAETYDPGSNFDLVNHRFVAPVSGYYQVNGSILWANLTANKTYVVHIYVNGSRVASHRFISNGAVLDFMSQSVSDIIFVATGSYIELYCYHDSGVGTEDIQNSTYYTYLSVHLLSAA